jgi:hypothetical protein
MKNFISSLIILLILFSPTLASNKINLVVKGKSNYRIVLPAQATKWDSLASKELQKYLKDISGAELPIINANSSGKGNEIILGHDGKIKKDGFSIKTAGGNLEITGGPERGSLNGIYSFLEKYLGCRMYSASVKVIPVKKNISLPQINIKEEPVFEYRDVHYKNAFDPDYSHWHKLYSDPESKKTWGLFVHTFSRLVPPEKYFKEHPEYFAELNGIRVADGQLCLSNPDVYKIVVDELRQRMKENPDAKIWSVSQNDNFSNCRCPECTKLDEQEGSPSGSLLNFVNKVAREFPDKIISTLAYQYTRKPPENIKPEKNVNIMFCSIECNRSKPLETDPTSAGFVNELKEWSKMAKSMIVWDYVVQFKNTVSPFPNFHVLQPNIQLFAKYKADMMFQQGAGGCIGAEFGELRCYIISKLLWNPNENVDALMNDFLNGYYGKGGKYIRQYIDILTDALKKTDTPLLIYGNPISPMKNYLAPELMKKYNQLFDKAEAAVKNTPEIFDRVKIARLPLKYAMLEQAKVIEDGENGLVIKDKSGMFNPNPKIEKLLDEFFNESKLTGRLVINEEGVTADEYAAGYKSLLNKTMKNPLGLYKPVQFLTDPSGKYKANGNATLTDGLRGMNDYNYNWIGYEAEDMNVVVDLQKECPVKKVSIDFLQDNNSWIFMPLTVEVSTSVDGKTFGTPVVIKNTVPEEKGKAFIETFSAALQGNSARYIKVKAVNMKVCPKWHKGYPGKAWIFADEIVVE